MWLYLVPKDMAKVEQMRALVTHVLFPTMVARRTAFVEGGIQRVLLPGVLADAGSVQVAPRAKPRIVLTLDGEDTHLQAMFSELIDTGFAIDEGIEIVKFAASASKFQQPCDVCPMFRSMKKSFSMVQEGWVCPDFSREVSQTLAMIPSASRKTFLTFLNHLPAVLSKSCTIDTIRKGWERTGLWPLNQETVLSRTAAWGRLTENQRYRIRRAMPELVEDAYYNGEVSESALSELVADISQHTEDEIPLPQKAFPWGAQALGRVDPVKQVKKGAPINHRRAIWLNHHVITQERHTRRVAKMAAEVKKSTKQAKAAAQSLATASGTTKPPKRGIGAIAGASKRAKSCTKTGRCGNAMCGVPSGEQRAWIPCSTCDLVFCEKEECQGIHQIHETTCEG
jgi:hypothetical protein